MKVSIVTTCRNREATIGNTVRSVMRQTFPDIEHILVDGASDDRTLQKIEECHSPRIATLISEKDRGCYEALNKGIRRATGDIVTWLHSDDIYFSDDVVAKVARIFEETGCDLFYADGLFVSHENPDWVIRDWISGTCSDKKISNGWLPLHTTVFVRRDVFDRFGYYDEDYVISSDTHWLLRVLYKTGIRVHYLHEYTVRMGYGGLSTSWTRTFHRWREDLGIYKRVGLSPRRALFKKVARKIPQYLKAPFSKAAKKQ